MIFLSFLAALTVETNSVDSLNMSDFTLGLVLTSSNMIIVIFAFYLGWRRYRKEMKLSNSRKPKDLKIEWAVEFSGIYYHVKSYFFIYIVII